MSVKPSVIEPDLFINIDHQLPSKKGAYMLAVFWVPVPLKSNLKVPYW